MFHRLWWNNLWYVLWWHWGLLDYAFATKQWAWWCIGLVSALAMNCTIFDWSQILGGVRPKSWSKKAEGVDPRTPRASLAQVWSIAFFLSVRFWIYAEIVSWVFRELLLWEKFSSDGLICPIVSATAMKGVQKWLPFACILSQRCWNNSLLFKVIPSYFTFWMGASPFLSPNYTVVEFVGYCCVESTQLYLFTSHMAFIPVELLKG